MILPLLMWLMIILCLAGCGAENFDCPGPGTDDGLYTSLYPYYAEFCALSQIKKKVGYGADIRGEIGGHSVFYLNGACRDPKTDYPTLLLCDQVPASADSDPRDGVGISMNSHFSNAKWVAIPGRAFFYDGDLPRDHGLTRTDYVRGKEEAKRLGIYRAVTFQDWVFDDKPGDVSREDWKYEVSIATDYAISFGRGRYCARVPVDRAQMTRMIAFLNAQNAPYRKGQETFDWDVFTDNCVHLAHNALTAAGVWREWPINRPLLISFFDFPVPKNEFVNLMRRVNDPPDLDLLELYHDQSAARSLAEFGRLPWIPGVVASSRGLQEPNQVYDTDVKQIFYDDPVTGRYQRRFDTILDHPRYSDIERNMDYFWTLYGQLAAQRKPLAAWLARDEFDPPAARQRFTDFYRRFYAFVDRERADISQKLARLNGVPGGTDREPLLSQAQPR